MVVVYRMIELIYYYYFFEKMMYKYLKLDSFKK